MACVDSSDEEDKSACQVSSTTVILESDISSQASHVTTETRDQAVESTAKNATANSKQGVLPSSKLETTYPSDLECVSENVELKGFTKSSSDAESLSNSKTKAPTVPSLTIRGRVMSDCTQVKKIRKKVVAKFADEAANGDEDGLGKVSYNNHQSSMAKKLSRVQFSLSKSISLGLDGVTSKVANIKRQPTGRKHRPRGTGSFDDALLEPEDSMKFRKTCERKGTMRLKSPTQEEESHPMVKKSRSASDITFRATVQRKGTARRVDSAPKRRRASDDEDSLDSCGDLPSSFQGQTAPRRGPMARMGLGRMFSSDSSANDKNVPKSQSNPVACLNATPGHNRRSKPPAHVSASRDTSPSRISTLMRMLKISNGT